MTEITHDGRISGQPAPKIRQSDKLLFCLFLAIAFHSMLMFGLGFELPDFDAQQTHKSFDVVLAQYQSDERPDKAAFIGQADQVGGGDSEQKLAPSTTEKARFNDPNQLAQQPQMPPAQPSQSAPQSELLSSLNGQPSAQPKPEQQPTEQNSLPDTATLIQKSYELDGLIANLDNKNVHQASKARKRQISASIHRSSDALYLDSWRRRIEEIGNQNYPEKARQQKIYGSLVLKVSINANGTIHSVRIMRSSGKKLLDDAAIRIVRLAAPFAPLTEEMRKDTDILEIIRVWNFEPGNRIKTG